MSSYVLINGSVINGDGVSVMSEGTVVIDGEHITAVYQGGVRPEHLTDDAKVIDCDGKVVLPGVINNHTHRTSLGPSGAYGAPPLARDVVVQNLWNHLRQGTTTVLCVDGFSLADEVIDDVPINVRQATIAYPSAFEAAKLSDGTGLTARHLAATVASRKAEGAVAVGECGAGGTLGGGSQDWLFIPAAVEERFGRTITPKQARGLKHAVLGRYIDREAYDADALQEALEVAELSDVLSIPEAKKLVEESVLPQFETALQSLGDGARVAKANGLAVILHNAAASKKVVDAVSREVAIVAGHSNHPSFEVGEAVDFARELKARGSIIDVGTLDSFGKKALTDDPAHMFALLEAGLVDTFSTDYAGGFHDSILTAVAAAVKEGVVSLPAAIRMTSLNVAKAVPGVAPNRGLVAPGRVADLVVADSDAVDRVAHVFVSGDHVVDQSSDK